MKDLRQRLNQILDSEWKKVFNDGQAFIDDEKLIEEIIKPIAKEAFEKGEESGQFEGDGLTFDQWWNLK